MTNSIVIYTTVLLLLPLVPLFIGRLSNFAGRYRLVALVVLLNFPSALIGTFSNYLAPNLFPILLVSNTIFVLPLLFVFRLIARFITRRYMPTVADALTSVLVGGAISTVIIIPAVYISFSLLFDKNISDLPLISALSLEISLPSSGLITMIAASISWVLFGWGTRPILRQRKATTLGLICVSISIISSILLITAFSLIVGNFSNEYVNADSIFLLLLTAGLLNMLIGMMAAGFMHGIFGGLASFFDLISFFVMIYLLYNFFTGLLLTSYNGNPMASLSIGEPSQHLVMIIGMSIVHMRVVMIGHRVMSIFSAIILTVPFVGIIPWIPEGIFALVALVNLFVFSLLWTGHWGVALRNNPHGGLISTILLIVALIATPAVFIF